MAISLSWQCESAVGYLAVYRLCFALSLFFFLMALIMIGVKTSKDPRAGIQNGFVVTSLDCIDTCDTAQLKFIL
jgi:hypothetical protein